MSAHYLDRIPPPPLPRLTAPWSLSSGSGASSRGGRALTATFDGEPIARVGLDRVPHLRLRACYPCGGHDLALALTPLTDHPSGPGLDGLLERLVPALFSADPHCRRVVAAFRPDEDAALRAFTTAGFRPVGEAELDGASLTLLAAEPARVTALSTAPDDMPH